MTYKGINLFGTENVDKEPVDYIGSGQSIYKPDDGDDVDLVECPLCGNLNLCREICQFCGQRFKQTEE